jgi:hypothetical protein
MRRNPERLQCPVSIFEQAADVPEGLPCPPGQTAEQRVQPRVPTQAAIQVEIPELRALPIED